MVGRSLFCTGRLLLGRTLLPGPSVFLRPPFCLVIPRLSSMKLTAQSSYCWGIFPARCWDLLVTGSNGPLVLVQMTNGGIKFWGEAPQAEGMIKLKVILKLTVWRPKALYMLMALVKDCLLTTFACVSKWLVLHVLLNLRETPIWKGSRKIRQRRFL